MCHIHCCVTPTGVPKGVETKQARGHVILPDIRVGAIGCIGGAPSPTLTPAFSPSVEPCCTWDGPDWCHNCALRSFGLAAFGLRR